MPITRIKKKIHDLRQEPEHVRLRAATIMTAASGGVLVVLWLAVFLPLQLRFNRTDDATQFPENALSEAARNAPENARVSGIRNAATVSPAPLAPQGGFFGSSPTNSPTVPAAVLPLSATPTPSPSPSTQPVAPVQIVP